MALTEKQSVPVSLGMGLDESVAAKQLQVPNALVCSDFTIESDGRYTKLEGVATLSMPDSGANGSESTLLQNRGQLGCLTTNGVYSYLPAGDEWVRRQSSSVYPITAVIDKLAVMGRRAINPDIASSEDGLLCIVWEETAADGVFSLFVDEAGNILSGPTRVNSLYSNYAPRVVAFDGTFILAWLDKDPRTSSGALYTQRYVWSAGDYVWSSVQSQGTSVTRFDIHAGGVAETYAYLSLTTATTTLQVRRLPSTGIADATASWSFAGGTSAIGHDTASSRVYVGYLDGSSDSVLKVLSEDLVTTHATTTLLASGSQPSWFSTERSFIRQFNGSTWAYVSSIGYPSFGTAAPGVYISTFDSAGNLDDSIKIYDVALHTRGVYVSDYTRLTDGCSGLLFGCHTHSAYHRLSGINLPQYPAAFLIRYSEDDSAADSRTIVCRYAENPSPDAEFDWAVHLNSIVPLSTGNYAHAFTRNIRDYDIITDDGISRIDYVEFDFQALHVPTASAEEGTLIGGGHVGFYDRFSAVENSLHVAPEIATINNFVLGAGTGGTVTQPAVDVTVVARWIDSLGRTHRSPPSHPLTVATSASQPLSVSVGFDLYFTPTLSNHNGDNAVDVVYDVYVSDHYDYGSGIGAGYETTPAGGTRWLRHTVFAPTRDVTDEMLIKAVVPSFNVPGNHIEAEYVQAGELSSDPTEPARDLVASANRVFFLSGTGKYVGYSKPLLTTTFAAEFNDAQRIQVPGEGRESTALAILDDKLVLFKRDSIYVTTVTGGNDANGSGAGFPQLRPIPTDSGCTNRRSVVTTPVGILFQGRRGIYLLDRNLQVRFVGAKIQDTLDGDVLSAVLEASRNEVVFGFRSDTVDGLIYNYEQDTWTTATAWRDGDSMLVKDGIWHGMRVGSAIRYRNPNTYTNLTLATSTSSGTRQPVLETAWIKVGSPQGYERVYRALFLGTYYSGNIRVRVAYDYDDTWVDSFSWAEANLTNPLQLRTPILSRQKIQSVKFEISEQTGDTEGKGFELEGLELEARVKQGTSYRQIQNRTGA